LPWPKKTRDNDLKELKKGGGFKKYQSLFYFLLVASQLRDVPKNDL
jgi:hypothetical protein